MRYYPLNYAQLNVLAGTTSPSTPKNINNRTFAFWSRALFERAVSVIDFEVPESWEGSVKDFLHYCLFAAGFVVVFDDVRFGQSFQPCSLYGFDFYYQPTKAIIANPAYHAELEIGSECQLLKLTPDYRGIWDVIEYYAEKLSLLDNAINASLINSRLAYIISASTKQGAQAVKKILDQINSGEPAVIWDKNVLRDPVTKETPFDIVSTTDNMAKVYLTSDQLMDMQTILHNFDSEIGIPSLPYQKKERMVTDEANMRKFDSQARSLVWIETLQSSIKQIKKLFPDIRLSASLHYGDKVDSLVENSEEASDEQR